MSFSGILFVKDTKIFWKGLESKKLINGETQISNGLRALIKNSNLNFFERNWIDVGNIDSYNKELQKTNPFDFSKDNEIIYFSNKKVVKFFCDINISENRYKRSKLNPNVFPKLIKYNHGFYEYNKIKGKTLYEYCNIQIFKSLLKFLDNKLWNKNINKVKNFEKICDKFYRIKTLQRLDLFLKNYPKIENVKLSNGIKLPKIKKLMSNFNWSEITNGIPVFFHGDLQFDNILYNNKQFKLIDWRQDFAGEIYFGDIYYDLSKLYGGLLINYNLIKKNQFNYYVKNEKEINYNLFNFHDSYEYINLLEKFILKKGLNLNKVKKIVGIIYLNMSPLHKSPFNEILYLHSKKILNEF